VASFNPQPFYLQYLLGRRLVEHQNWSGCNGECRESLPCPCTVPEESYDNSYSATITGWPSTTSGNMVQMAMC